MVSRVVFGVSPLEDCWAWAAPALYRCLVSRYWPGDCFVICSRSSRKSPIGWPPLLVAAILLVSDRGRSPDWLRQWHQRAHAGASTGD